MMSKKISRAAARDVLCSAMIELLNVSRSLHEIIIVNQDKQDTPAALPADVAARIQDAARLVDVVLFDKLEDIQNHLIK